MVCRPGPIEHNRSGEVGMSEEVGVEFTGTWPLFGSKGSFGLYGKDGEEDVVCAGQGIQRQQDKWI